MKIQRIVSLISCIVLTGCFASLPTDLSSTTKTRVDPVQLGDNKLTCNQIKAEVAKMDAVIDQADSVTGSFGTKMAGTQAAQVAGSHIAVQALPYTMIGFLSPILSVAGLAANDMQINSQANAAEAKSAAMQRKHNLIALHNKKGCR